jgi:hypothetical protein
MATTAKRADGKGASEIDRSPRLLPKLAKPEPKSGAKKAKTGGRVVKTVEQKMAEGAMASQISGWHDDTTLDEELAAIYMGVSKKKLEELRLAEEAKEDKSARLEIIKIISKGAKGQNQPVQYKLGRLREYQKKHTYSSSFEAAIAAGMAAWCSVSQPFFAELEQRRRVATLVAPAWDSKRKGRETLFERHAKGELRMVWMTAQDASSSRWSKLSAHKSFAKTGKDMLRKELSAIKAAIVGTDLAEELSELKRKTN